MPTMLEGGEPLYVQIAQILRKEIVEGVFPVGSQLPIESDLCQRFSVSRYTVRCALEQLRNDGLILSRRRSGTTVIPPPALGSRNFGAMSIEDLLHFARGSYIDIQQVRLQPIDAAMAAYSGLTEGEPWLTVQAIGYERDTDEPLGWTDYFINRDYAGVSRLLQRHKAPIFPLIEDLFGIQIVEVNQQISAKLMPTAMAGPLRVAAATPALEIRHTYRLGTGKIVQIAINNHPAERYRHNVTMRRVK